MVRIISALILAVTAVSTFAEAPALADNPPDRHVVVKGDTLWGISGKFLKQPWRWPEVWQLNKEQIRNPHLIYPGDVVYLDLSGDEPRLRLGKPLGTDKLQPKVYTESLRKEIPSIPPHIIEPFISQPLVIEANGDAGAPRIVASQEDRVLLGNGDTGFVSGIADAKVEHWNIYRPGKPMKDPDTGEVIGHEAFFLGNARLVQPGEPAVVRVVVAKEEIARGDRLVPAPPANIIAYVPHEPSEKVAAKVMSIYGGVNEGGRYSVVALNRGASNGLEVGHVLALFRKRVSEGQDDNGKRVQTAIPDERYALAFVFRTFDKVAYALVMEAAKPVLVGDAATNP